MISNPTESTIRTPAKREIGVDWRNTLFRFHLSAAPKYKLGTPEIAVYTSLLSVANYDGTVSMSNTLIMAKSGIGNERTFKKARDRLIQSGIINIAKKGSANRENTTYQVKLLGRPKRKTGQKEGG